eukprot:scaffold12982_cov129-Cylindrotheca_fusiformis.AAC.7
MGDVNYHYIYGTFSTAATASIGYGFYKLQKAIVPPNLIVWNKKPPVPSALGAWAFMTLGVFLASQTLPKFQVPVTIVDSKKVQVRCPFDFTGKKTSENIEVYGTERITRHPGLWSLGCIGVGQSFVATSVPLRLWWLGPSFVAWLGGAHADSRFRRGLGGTMDPFFDSQTSNLPFWAVVSGKQGNGSVEALLKETKELNAAAAIAASTLWILRKIK